MCTYIEDNIHPFKFIFVSICDKKHDKITNRYQEYMSESKKSKTINNYNYEKAPYTKNVNPQSISYIVICSSPK